MKAGRFSLAGGVHESTGDNMAESAPQITDHQLLRCIGRGSYGEVWLARSVIGTFRAAKIVYRRTFDTDQPYEREFRGIQKFEPVSRTHEGLVDILQVGRNDEAGYFYYIMELADDSLSGQDITPSEYTSKTLGDEVSLRGKLPAKECLELSLSLTSALAHLHRRGLIHRDIKPSNIIFVNGIPKIADIGLVADAGASGSFVGTPGFIPPEGPGSPQADIYSLGKVLYEITTGKDRLEFPELPSSLCDTPESRELMELNEIVLKASEKDHRLRYHSAEEMHADLVLLQAGKSVQRLRLLERRLNQLARVSLFIVATAAIIAGMFFLERARRNEVRQRLVGRYVSSGLSAMKEGDLIGSLPLFTEALRLDVENKNFKSEETHRMRIASVLERCPRLVQMWLRPQAVWRAEFVPDGGTVLLSVMGEGCHFWNLTNGNKVSETFGPPLRENKASLSRNGKWVVTAGGSSNIWVAAAANPAAVEIISHTAALEDAQLSPDGQRVVGASVDHTAVIWDRAGRAPPLKLLGHTNQVWHAEFSSDGRRVVTASIDSSAIVWNSHTGERGPTLRHSNWVYYATFSADGSLVATSSFDRTARVWDAATGEPKSVPLHHNDGVRSVAFSPDGKWLVTSGLDFVVHIWDFRQGTEAFTPLPHSGKVMHAAFSPDGSLLVTACWDGTVRVWDLTRPKAMPTPSLVIFSPDGRRFAEPSGGQLQIKDAFTNQSIASIPRTVRSLSEAHFSAHGDRLVTITPVVISGGDNFQVVQLWNAATGQDLGLAWVISAELSNSVLSGTGEKVAFFGGKKLTIRDTTGGSELFNLTSENEVIKSAEFSSDGETIAIASSNLVQLWDLRSRGPVFKTPLQHPAEVTHVEFASNNLSLITTCANADYDAFAAQIWDARTGAAIGPPLPHADGVLHAVFSPDLRRVATASEDFSAMIWDTRRGTLLTPPLKHAEQVQHVAFNSDGRWVITATSISGQPGAARVWDSVTGEPVTPSFLHPERLKQARFVAGDQKILTITRANETRVWALPRAAWPVEDLIRHAQLLAAQPMSGAGSAQRSPQKVLYDHWLKLRTSHPEEFVRTGK
ncbi:MAG: protein kinase [Verrucomicrobia bacterium]|nr:protein kinase [Verrucomicrobiota bacterium]